MAPASTETVSPARGITVGLDAKLAAVLPLYTLLEIVRASVESRFLRLMVAVAVGAPDSERIYSASPLPSTFAPESDADVIETEVGVDSLALADAKLKTGEVSKIESEACKPTKDSKFVLKVALTDRS